MENNTSKEIKINEKRADLDYLMNSIFSDLPENEQDIIKKIVDSNSEVEYDPRAKNRIIPDISLVKEKFGWFPLTLLEDALRDTIDYMKAAKNTFNAGDFFKKDESVEAKLKESSESIEKNKNESNIFRMIFKG